MSEVNVGTAAACLACGMELRGPWCHACGQRHRPGRLSSRALMTETADEWLSLDTRLIRTVRMLTRDPGRTCREYLAGKRTPWMHPLKYALLTATIAFLVQRWLFGLLPAPEDAAALRVREFQLDFGQLINFSFLPLWAAVTRLLFPRSGLRWVEHLVVALYGFGHLFFMQTCLMSLVRAGPEAAVASQVISQLLPIPYLAWLAVTVFGARWWTALLRVLLAWLVTQVILGALMVYFWL